jgi:hypothetical protein
MHGNGLLAPMTALVAWSLVMCAWLYATRLPAMYRLGIRPEVGRFAGGTNDVMPASARQAADNYNHLMEQPTIFYAICVVLQLMGQGDDAVNLGLAWSYVTLRVAHSLVHATVNHVPTRFTVFMLATFALAGLVLRAASGLV